jgi:D-amino-acid dehydrogenase
MNNKVHIVGGGIIGISSAWYLTHKGFEVTIIDKSDFKNGTSFGNAGMIVPSHFIPLSTPGMIGQGLKWLLNNKSPFYIKPRLNADLVQWLWHFYRSANAAQVRKAMPVLYEMHERGKELYQEIATEYDFDFCFEKRGLLMLYKTQKQAREEEEFAEKAHRLGVKAELLDAQGLRTLEPHMDLDVLGGLYFPGDAHLHPNRLMHYMREDLEVKGVQFIARKEVTDFKLSGSKVVALIDESGNEIPVENVLISSGAWAAQLLKKAGVKIFLQDGKGYSITMNRPDICPQIPTILSEARVAITPMGNNLRIGGTLELSGLSDRISKSRVHGIVESIPAYYKNLKIPFTHKTRIWKGYRPCTPDGMPYIGKSSKLSNLVVGTGHGMMGLSLGAITGKLICQIFVNEKTALDVDLFRLNRF